MRRSILLAFVALFSINTLADDKTPSAPGIPPSLADIQSAIPKTDNFSITPMPRPSIYSPIPEIDPAFSSPGPKTIEDTMMARKSLMPPPGKQVMPVTPDAGPRLNQAYGQAMNPYMSQYMTQPWPTAPNSMSPYSAPTNYGWNAEMPGYGYAPAMPAPAYAGQWSGQPDAGYMPYPPSNGLYQPMMQNAYPVMPQVIYEWVPITTPYDTMPYGTPWQTQQQSTPNYNSNATFRPPQMQGTP